MLCSDTRDMWRAWEILDCPVDDPQQQTAFDMLRIDVALRYTYPTLPSVGD
jgi:hypothetical protein